MSNDNLCLEQHRLESPKAREMKPRLKEQEFQVRQLELSDLELKFNFAEFELN